LPSPYPRRRKLLLVSLGCPCCMEGTHGFKNQDPHPSFF
jgi:hypothetical protein